MQPGGGVARDLSAEQAREDLLEAVAEEEVEAGILVMTTTMLLHLLTRAMTGRLSRLRQTLMQMVSGRGGLGVTPSKFTDSMCR